MLKRRLQRILAAAAAQRERMFGRVRASSISSLEMERPPPKIIKHDPLSIYESTLLKLKQGSHCNPKCNPEEDAFCIMPIDEAMTTDADCSSTSSLLNPTLSFQSTGEQTSKNMSILHFFSKCNANTSNEKEVMVIGSGDSSSSSSSVSPTSSS